jgi:hypothetical protein
MDRLYPTEVRTFRILLELAMRVKGVKRLSSGHFLKRERKRFPAGENLLPGSTGEMEKDGYPDTVLSESMVRGMHRSEQGGVGRHVPCADRDGGGQHVCSQPWSHIDEETGPLGQFNTCCLQCFLPSHSCEPLSAPQRLSPPLSHHQYIYGSMCLPHEEPTYGRKRVLFGLEHTIRSSK